MTGLELMKEYAARESAMMRKNLDVRNPAFIMEGHTSAGQSKRDRMVRAIQDDPGQTRSHYLKQLGITEHQWRRGIEALLSKGRVVSRREGFEPYTYWPVSNDAE